MMNNIVANFDQILKFAAEYGLPEAQKRAIIREYLQVKILDLLYHDRRGAQMIFIGGTSLRLTRTLDRFSEDLDFDVKPAFLKHVPALITDVSQLLQKENIAVDVYTNSTAKRNYFELRFPDLLFDLGISHHEDEKLMIKLDCESTWRHLHTEQILMNRYGYLATVVTIPLSHHLIQKMAAYLNRKQTQPRDIYDMVWLIAQGAHPDWEFARQNGIDHSIIKKVLEKFERERTQLTAFQKRLRPFLITEHHEDRLLMFPALLETLK